MHLFEAAEGEARTRQVRTWQQEMRYTLRPGGPLALGELGWMSTYIVDALMIGRLPAAHSLLAQASALLGNTVTTRSLFSAIFLLNGLETLTAQAYGQGCRLPNYVPTSDRIIWHT